MWNSFTFLFAAGIADLCKRWDPEFDQSRLVIKVPSTWEGFQACRELKEAGIQTLATTLFTIEQGILAAEAGCVSIAPFVHELRVHFDKTFVSPRQPISSLTGIDIVTQTPSYLYVWRLRGISETTRTQHT